MKYFSIKELCHSDTAESRHIANNPPAEAQFHLRQLIEQLLDPLREEWGSAIKVNSGYRSAVLNKAVGGSSSSAHLLGYAADIVPANGEMSKFKAFVRAWLKGKAFDQYIDERGGVAEWVHLAIKNKAGLQRGQYLAYRNGKYSAI